MNLEEEEKKLAKLQADLEAAHDLVHEIALQRNALQETINNEKMRLEMQRAGSITTEFFMSLDWNIVTGDFYKALTHWFHQNYGRRGVFQSGMWSDTHQVALKLQFDQNRPFEEQLGILDFVKFIKPDKDGDKPIGIFEHTLSQHASWCLIILPDGKVELLRNRFTDREFDKLEDALKYVYEKHPYEVRKKSSCGCSHDDSE